MKTEIDAKKVNEKGESEKEFDLYLNLIKSGRIEIEFTKNIKIKRSLLIQ